MVLPRERRHILDAIPVCRHLGAPVTVRGEGTTTSGQGVGSGVAPAPSRSSTTSRRPPLRPALSTHSRRISLAAGEQVLLPVVRDASPGTRVLAHGFSHRVQIGDHTDREGAHLARLIASAPG
ncbi:hypothetical protein [Streptomyces sp. S3(2020)]|uniref:hypothetical protein n=1 Tax=Streptomyces sp. S3(2020) TaxID=2732044 RepID=UPI0019D300C4|nr:hypothetical protein [Streptomyces sp. S3(2020)]